MFLIELTYQVPVTEIEPAMAEHLAFLEKYYASGHFLASGRKVPRNGGLILCKATDKAQVVSLMQEDPLVHRNLVELRIVEFTTSRAEDGLKGLLD